jgi:IS5 family transposase
LGISDFEYVAKKRVTRRDRFLSEIDAVMPKLALVAEIDPLHPNGKTRGRSPIDGQRMLAMYIAHRGFELSDDGIEDAIYDSQAIRGFIRST